MPNRPIDILKSLPGLAGWSAVSRKTLRYELFFNGQGVENRRVVEDLGGHVTLLARNGKEFGVAGFDISGAGETDFRRQLDQAVARARVGAEPAFELPGPPASYGRVFLVDPGVRDNADVMPLRVRSAIETGLAGAPGVHLSMAEVSVAKTREAVINSAGAAAENDLSDYEVELVLLAGAGSREQERLVSFRRRRFEDMNLSAQVAVEAQRALDRVEAGAPAAGPTAVILGMARSASSSPSWSAPRPAPRCIAGGRRWRSAGRWPTAAPAIRSTWRSTPSSPSGPNPTGSTSGAPPGSTSA